MPSQSPLDSLLFFPCFSWPSQSSGILNKYPIEYLPVWGCLVFLLTVKLTLWIFWNTIEMKCPYHILLESKWHPLNLSHDHLHEFVKLACVRFLALKLGFRYVFMYSSYMGCNQSLLLLFSCSRCPSVGLWELLQVGSCISFIC